MSKGFAVFIRFFGVLAAVLGFFAVLYSDGETADSTLFLLAPILWGTAILILSFSCAKLIDRMVDTEEELKRLKEKLDK
jgi:hypothetical protein